VHAAVLAWPIGSHTAARGGDLLARVLADVDRLDTAVSEKLAGLVREGLVAIALAAYLVRLDPALAAGSFLAAPLVAAALTAFGRRARSAGRRAQAELGTLASVFQEGVTGVRVVKAFRMEGSERSRFAAAVGRLRAANLSALRVAAASPPLMEMLGGAAAAGVFLVGSSRIGDGRMTVGGFTSFLTTLLLLYTPVKKVSNANHFLQGSLAAAERIFEVLDAPREAVGEPEGEKLGAPRDAIRLEDVWFRYADDWVLRGVDLEIPAGKVTALIGPSGGGKSTVASLLLRFADPTRGRLTWDGRDLREIGLATLRDQVALVPQEIVLFHDTVARNVAGGREDVSRAALAAAVTAARAAEFVGALPQGYETVLGERGESISQGQRQRLAIARALVRGAPLLILDEATSALDRGTERGVQEAIDARPAGTTVLLIAHRLNAVEHADQIVVLDDGRVIEAGPRQDLARRPGAYARMRRSFLQLGDGA
jgi:subfamily B ATP-binding cassette protein MsbA